MVVMPLLDSPEDHGVLVLRSRLRMRRNEVRLP